MEALVERLIEWFALPKHGLSSVFIVSFLSATLLPLGSEPAVFGFITLNPDKFWITVAVATLGNTLGGIVDYVVGRGAKEAFAKHKDTRYFGWLQRLGPPVLILSWLPMVGDPLCTLAGWLRLPFWRCVLWMAIGKFGRYVVMTSLLLWVPHEWWLWLLRPLLGDRTPLH
ncbi:MAG TPA: YqaA family protein [Burkholderiaceae bacterium]|nr:YqaA family protein [Burkholderiaceae bacterium]